MEVNLSCKLKASFKMNLVANSHTSQTKITLLGTTQASEEG